MIANPFDHLDKRLTLIESLLLEIKTTGSFNNDTSVRQPATREQAAEHLSLSISTLDKLLASNQINYFRIGRQIRIKWSDIDAYLNKQ